MEFKTNTKPLSDAVNIGVINSNVTSAYKQSNIILVTLCKDKMKLNIDFNRMCIEITVPGMGSEDDERHIYVNIMKFKQLLNTFDGNTTDFIIDDNGLTMKCGSGKFILPKEIDFDPDLLITPGYPDDGDVPMDLDKATWKFISDRQMYAISTSFTYPAYTRAWVGEEGGTLVGDFVDSLFNHSDKRTLGMTCLLMPTIVNLLNTVPEGSKFIRSGQSFIIMSDTDGYSLRCEFTPEFEDDPQIGTYNSDLILSIFTQSENAMKVDPAKINKFLTQASIIAETKDDVITIKFDGNNTLSFVNTTIDYPIQVEGNGCEDFEILFKIEQIKRVLSKYSTSDYIFIAPAYNDGSVVGLTIWDDDLTTTVSGVD